MISTSNPILLAVAAPVEAAAVIRAFPGVTVAASDWQVVRLSAQFRLIVTGIGKVNAAGAISRAIERGSYRAVMSLGIAGALPGGDLRLGQIVLATSSVSAEEGIVTPDGFQTCAQMGFPLGRFEGNAVPGDAALLAAMTPVITRLDGRTGRVATVSTCSGTNALAEMVTARTGAIAEAMEGAAVGQVVARVSDHFPRRTTAFAEVRTISNTTGDRSSQRWEIRRALDSLTDVTKGIVEAI